jgi:signal transduction histidine kinase
MFAVKVFDRLAVKLTAAFLLAAVLGVALVAVLAYSYTSSDFDVFVRHMRSMQGMMGGMQTTLAEAETFLDNFGQTLWIAGLSGAVLAMLLGGLSARRIVAPLSTVSTAARLVAAGDLTQRVNIGGSGELAELGESFNVMAETLSRDRELRRNMVADIAHELRTPLSIIMGNTEAMLDGVLEANAENLHSLHQETALLARLVEDLRTLSLAEAGQLRFYARDMDLKELASQVIEGFQAQFAARKVRVALQAPDEGLRAYADPDRTAQVMRNLLSNAFHYTPEGGRVTVRLSAATEGATVSVADSGAGIPAEDLPHVFDRFYRVDRSRSRSTGGSGLGLAIVKQLVEMQGGRVWADSALGKGSTFAFSLPLAAGSVREEGAVGSWSW